jgi:signal transduction histidine kinase
VPVRQGGELLAIITAAKAGPGSFTPRECHLLADLAAHAGIVTRGLRLRETLRRRLDESQARQRELVDSRARLLAAQDEERRRLERDIHDSCQQRAVVLAGRLGLAATLAAEDPAGARAALAEAAADVARLDEALQRLTSGVPEPALASHGVAAALRAETESLPVAVEISDGLHRRHDPAVEATIYHCGLEAIQNATRHARASRIRVRLSEHRGHVALGVRDNGAGFDVDLAERGSGTGLRNMRERLRPWQGRLTIRSSPNGTSLRLEIPVGAPS